MTFTLAMLPIVACTTFGAKASAVSRLQMIVAMPNQSAMRIIVPRFPGSCTPSRTRHRLLANHSGAGNELDCGVLKIPITCWGCCRKLALRNSSSLTRMCSASLEWLLGMVSNHSSVPMRHCGWKPARSSSLTILVPSATKTPSLCLAFFCSRLCMYFSLFLLIIVQSYDYFPYIWCFSGCFFSVVVFFSYLCRWFG